MQLAAKPADLRLFPQAEQGPQRFFYGFALGLQARYAKRIAHQPIVDYDVRSHRCVSSSMIIHIQARIASAFGILIHSKPRSDRWWHAGGIPSVCASLPNAYLPV
jgi:hypothetical protein